MPMERGAVRETATFLFTDVEGSTRLLGRVGDDYPALLERHRVLLRGAFARHGGREVGTEGDGFFVVFPTASGAVLACVEGQTALAHEPWTEHNEIRVRMGMHSGLAVWEHDEIYGLAVHQAARIAAAAHGGQIVASDATRQLTREEPPADCTWRALGEFEFKDVGRHEVFQVVHPRLQAEFPVLRARARAQHNLPRQATRLFGRDQDVEQVTALVAADALVTLTGAGGIGKTRLALEAAGRTVGSFADGVWFVPLANVSDPAQVASAVATTFGIRPGAPERMTELLVDHLHGKAALVVLDNCEHVVDASAGLVSDLLEACDRLTVLATSRESLGIPGEIVVRVPSLAVSTDLSVARSRDGNDATALFLDRAAQADPGFTPTEADIDAVVEICQRLDGIPLAIELAAARVNVLAPAQIAARLDDRFALLTSGPRVAETRQQTLRAAVDWSHDLLTVDEQVMLRQLSVFVGDFTLEAVEGVVEQAGFASAMDLVDMLAAKSLLVPVAAGDGRRYRLLETMRQFGREQLDAAGETDAVTGAHADWYSRWATGEFERLGSAVLDADARIIERERPNLLAALRWAVDAGDHDRMLGLAIPLAAVWLVCDYLDEGRDWMDRILDTLPPSARAGVLHVFLAGMLLSHDADRPGGLEHARRGVELLRAEPAENRRWIESGGLAMWSVGLYRTGDADQARDVSDESIRVARDCGDRRTLASSLCGRVGLHDAATLRSHLAEAAEIFRALGSDTGLCRCGWLQADLEAHDGNVTLAISIAEEAVESGTRFGPNGNLVNALTSLALLRFGAGDVDGALEAATEALELAERTGSSQIAATIRAAIESGAPPTDIG